MTALLHFYRRICSPSEGSEDGFSVLEAMIAMAILSAALIPLLTLQGQLIRNVESFERAEVRFSARDSALTYLNNLNFTLTPSGSLDLGTADMRWSSTLAGPPQMSRGDNGVEGRFEMSLYDVTVQLDFKNGQQDEFAIRSIGWRPVGSFLPE